MSTSMFSHTHTHTHTHVCIYYIILEVHDSAGMSEYSCVDLRDYENQRKYRITRILGQGPSYELEIYEMMRHFL